MSNARPQRDQEVWRSHHDANHGKRISHGCPICVPEGPIDLRDKSDRPDSAYGE